MEGGDSISASPPSQQQQGGEFVQSERLVSSRVLHEEYLDGGEHQQQHTTYVERPVPETVIRQVPRAEYIEIERHVPRYDVEWVDRVVEVPEIQYADREIESSELRGVVINRPVPDRQPPSARSGTGGGPAPGGPAAETPAGVVEVPRPYAAENRRVIPRYVDKEVNCVVAQTLKPIIQESETEFVDVEMREFNPYIIPVDIMVPRPVARQLIAQRKTDSHVPITDIPVAHFNALLRQLNPHLTDTDLQEKFRRSPLDNSTPIAPPLQFHPLVVDQPKAHTTGN